MFNIEENSEIYFYGYSRFDLVKDKYNSMLSEGYKVRGFIDKKADEIRKTMPCWSVEEFIYGSRGKENVVIIFLLQNAMEHEGIVRSFIAEGYKKILFIPATMNSKERRKMYEIYNIFLEGGYRELCNIPNGDEVLEEKPICRELVRTGENWLTYFVPAELLYSYGSGQLYGDENIRFCIPYRELYDYLSGKCETCAHYLEFMEKKDNAEFLMDRQKLFLLFEHERNLGMDYFVETAAYVKWNDKGYFNIIDGHHRAAYLAYKGYVQIPVRMEKRDFLNWKNEEEAAGINCISNLPCPIPLPGFADSPCSFEPRWKQVTDFFFMTLPVRKKRKLHFVEADMNFGYYARLFQRANKFKSIIVLPEKQYIGECQVLNNVLRQNIEICETLKTLNTEIHAAYIDMEFWDEELLEDFLNAQGSICLVFEVTERNEKQCLDKIQNIMGASAEFICHYRNKEMKKIYGITRGEKSNG